MRNSKLFGLLRLLSKEELEALGKYLSTDYFNNNKITYQLYQYIYKYRKHIHEEKFAKFNKRIVFRSLFEGEYEDSKIRRVMSLLSKEIENFWVIEELRLKENSNYRNKLLLQSLSRKRDYQKFKLEVETYIRKLQSKKYKSRNDFLDLFWLFEKLYTHPATNSYNFRIVAGVLTGLVENLDEFLVSSKLFWGLELKTRQKILNEHSVTDFFLDEAIRISRSFTDSANRYEFMRKLLCLNDITEQDAAILQELIEEFTELYAGHAKEVPDSEAILTAITNNVIRFVNAGVFNLQSLLLDIYKFEIEEDLIVQNGFLRGIQFSNIAIHAAYLKEFEWAESFMMQHSEKLPITEKDQVINLSYAYLHFHKGLAESRKESFVIAQEYLSKIPYKFIENDIRIRTLQLRLLYENEVLGKGNGIIVFDNASAFKAFLGRNHELSETKKRSYSNFIDAIVALTRLYVDKPHQRQNTTVEKLINLLNDDKQELISKSWLLDKFDEWQNKSGATFLAWKSGMTSY